MVDRAPQSYDPEEEDSQERFERLAADAGVHKEAWNQTLEDMHALADEREQQGWDVIELISGSTGTEGRDSNADDEPFGFTYVVPGDEADQVEAAVEAGDFPIYDVYRAETNGRVFLLTELRDPETETIVFIAGSFLRHFAQPLVEAAVAEGKVYSHVQKLDGTQVATFEHDGYEKFFPEADRVVSVE